MFFQRFDNIKHEMKTNAKKYFVVVGESPFTLVNQVSVGLCILNIIWENIAIFHQSSNILVQDEIYMFHYSFSPQRVALVILFLLAKWSHSKVYRDVSARTLFAYIYQTGR